MTINGNDTFGNINHKSPVETNSINHKSTLLVTCSFYNINLL